MIGARGRDGSFAAYDPPRNEHENHILRRSTVPAPLSRREGQGRGRDRVAHRREARLCRRARRRAVRHATTEADRQRDRAARAQFRALDDRSLRDQPVRAAHPRGRRLAAGRSRAPLRCGDGEHHRRGGRAVARAGAAEGAACTSTASASRGRAARWATSRGSSPLGSIEAVSSYGGRRRCRKCRAGWAASPSTRAPRRGISRSASRRRCGCRERPRCRRGPRSNRTAKWISVAP